MKIYKVCHSVCISLESGVSVVAPACANDVQVFTSKRRAIIYATTSMWNYRDVMGYKVREVDDAYIRSWILDSGSTRRVIQVIEDETKWKEKSRANADHVKNLSPQFLRRAKFELIKTCKELLWKNF